MRFPVATYRLQFNSTFGFRDALGIVPYLHDLGISDIYVSPIFRARAGSAHGYDVVDHSRMNPELGSAEDFSELVVTLQSRGMGLLLDMVPNHMAYSPENPLIYDVLERGERSRYYNFFDVDWSRRFAGMSGKILAPFLGDLYENALERSEISLAFGRDGLVVDYRGFRLPLSLKSYPRILGLESDAANSPIPGFLRDMIAQAGKNPEIVKGLKQNLWNLCSDDLKFKAFFESRLAAFRGRSGDPRSFDLLDKLLLEQIFYLSFWKVASEEINYRRFFTINDLISLRVERLDVFDYVHTLLLDLIRIGAVTGLRIDHIDGLYDPKEYLCRLNEHLGDIYTVVEKILAWDEELPNWPVSGTTGYDFLNMLNGIFCCKDNATRFEGIYRDFSGLREPYGNIVYKKKKLIKERYMGGDVDNLARLLKRASEKDRQGHDFSFSGLRNALGEFMASLSVYRTYGSRGALGKSDLAAIQAALARALERCPEAESEITFLGKVLTDASLSEERRACYRDFAARLQQFTGPFMAKGFEDTVLYCYNNLISLNEVGGSPERFGTTVEEFHRFNERRLEKWPNSLNATATHDTKRGEDSRMRISVLSLIPDEWRESVMRWSRQNEPMKRKLYGVPVPDRNEEYLIYQALIGAFPFQSGDLPSFLERAKGYLVKALREAKAHSDWMRVDRAYEDAVLSFFQDIMDPSSDFYDDFASFQRKVAILGIRNSLSQTLLKIVSPGVPDFFQGTELWDFSFVDPDNRRPVDYQRRMSYLAEMRKKGNMDLLQVIRSLLAEQEDGRIKLFLINRLLMARRDNADLFLKGTYRPIAAEGMHKGRVVAFARVLGNKWALALAPRFPASLGEGSDDALIRLPKEAPMRWRNAITGEDMTGGKIYLREAFRHLPVALLMGEAGQ